MTGRRLAASLAAIGALVFGAGTALAQDAAAAPVMHCHDAGAIGGATVATESSSFEKTIRSVDCCCPNHDCCRGLKTSERASIASNTISPGYFLVEPAAPIRVLIHVSDVFAGPDSARAPPLL